MQRTKLTSNSSPLGIPIWQNDEDHPIIILDGKVEFFDEKLGAAFRLYVKGTKGRGVADADKLTKLSDKHKFLIYVMQAADMPMTSEAILLAASRSWDKTHSEPFKINPYKRTISELYRRKILLKDDTNPPHYSLHQKRSIKALESGLFE